MFDLISEFKEAALKAGIILPDVIYADDILHYFSTNGKSSDKAGRYVLHAGPKYPAGWGKNWRTGDEFTWHAKPELLSHEEELEYRRKIKELVDKREEQEKERYNIASLRGQKIWNTAKALNEHPYLTRKQVISYGIKCHHGVVVIPVRIGGKISSLQFITADGKKSFLKGGKVSGGYFSIGQPKDVICIVEGYATGSTIYQATGHAVAVAFCAGNLKLVAQSLRDKFPTIKIIVAADNDVNTKGNPGLTRATEAAFAIDGLVAVPDFGKSQPEGLTDFNDLARYKSLDSVKICIESAKAPESLENICKTDNKTTQVVTHEWQDPLPLVDSAVDLYPYPIEALPEGIRNAVQEVVNYSLCPIALPACSALSILSLVGQGLVDVRRRNGELTGPVSLYFLVVASSGERKTSSDQHFSKVISEWESQERNLMKPVLKEYFATDEAWRAEFEGVKAEIKSLAKRGKPTDEKKKLLIELELSKPKKPQVPRLIYADSTPEALAYSLSTVWPSGGILSSEAGIVFGSHGMKADSAMSNLALLNTLWDGGTIPIDRKQSGSFILQGARLTMGLAVQVKTLHRFFKELKGLARDIGFTARFLVSYPKSTIGTRLIDNSKFEFYHLPIFNKRMIELLKLRLSINDSGGLALHTIGPSDEANDAWISFYNDVEREMAPGGDMEEIRDSASKAAENVSRLAALFHLFENGVTGLISKEHMEQAAKIITYHLYEKKRFDNHIALPESLINADKLDTWLIKKCIEENKKIIPANEVLHSGPSSLRLRKDRDSAIEILIERHRIRVFTENRQTFIEINPKLLENRSAFT